ncbi:hypothetical protein MRB53_042191 [Persea americana]|nr:hypothetical protein MRB53_042191 [Persea americana]
MSVAISSSSILIDWNKFQQRVGCKSVASARELLRVAKNKLKDEYSNDAQTSASVDNVKSPGAVKSPAYKVTKNKATGNKKTASTITARQDDPEESSDVKVKVEPDLLEDEERSADEYY